MKKLVFRNGKMEFIYNEDLLENLIPERFKTEEIKRASHVEPDPDKPGFWYADLTPSGGEKITGFKTRTEAINYEIDYLNKEYLKIGKI